MRLRSAAGLALFLLSLVRHIRAHDTLIPDQQLLYDGLGWHTSGGPQGCAGVGTSVHATSRHGDSVSVDFTGDGVYVLGSHTPLSNPMTVILDGDVQQVPPATDEDGCGVLYANLSIPNSRQKHKLVLRLTATPGSSTLIISGVRVTAPDEPVSTMSLAPNMSSAVSPPTSVSIISISTASTTTSMTSATTSGTSTATSGTSTATSATSAATSATSTTSATISTTSATISTTSATIPTTNATSTTNSTSTAGDSSSDPNTVDTSFESSPHMTANLIGAIVGTILAMLLLLGIFVFIRRRITRNTARKRDQKNSFGRSVREREIEEDQAKIGAEDGWWPVWGLGGKKTGTVPYDLESNVQEERKGDVDSVANFQVPSPVVTIGSRASGSHSRPEIVIATSPLSGPSTTRSSPRSATRTLSPPSTTYTVNFGHALLNRAPSQKSLPPTPGSSSPYRQTPSPLTIPLPSPIHDPKRTSLSHSPVPPGLELPYAATSSGASHRIPSPVFLSPSEARGGMDASERPYKAYVVNRTESIGSSRSARSAGEPPTGYF